jgi:hypothetical protein
MGWLGRFVLITCVAAAINFSIVFVQNAKAASNAGTRVVDGHVITICYFGPPVSFYSRFFAFAALLLAVLGIFRRTFSRSITATAGVAGALSAYVYWWIHSYRVFRNFTDFEIPFLNHPEIKQVAYLYNGTWFDVCVVASLVVSFVLLVDRLFKRRNCVVPPNY